MLKLSAEQPLRRHSGSTFFAWGAFSAAVLVAVFEGVWLIRSESDISAYRHIVAGSTRFQIEAAFGPPRFSAEPGNSLKANGWNGAAGDRIADRPQLVYSMSPWLFVICEFDADRELRRATISRK